MGVENNPLTIEEAITREGEARLLWSRTGRTRTRTRTRRRGRNRVRVRVSVRVGNRRRTRS